MVVAEGDERYLSMEVLKVRSWLPYWLGVVGTKSVPLTQNYHYHAPASQQGLDLFKLSAGAEVPNYQAILGPNDVFGLGASL